jgi:hypothetical protein
MFLFFIAVYLVIFVPTIMLFWALMVVAKWNDIESGYDPLEDRISSIE